MENSSQKSNKGVMIAIVIILVLIGGYVFVTKSKSDKMVPPTQTSTTQESGSTPVTDENALAVSVSGAEFSFSPSSLALKVGQPVSLTFTNTGKMPHDFIIDEITGAKTPMVKPGESATVTFTPSTAGVFKFYCGVGNHRAQGMEGTVTVN